MILPAAVVALALVIFYALIIGAMIELLTTGVASLFYAPDEADE